MPKGLERRYGQCHLHFITCSCYRHRAFFRSFAARDLFLTILDKVRKRYRFSLDGYVVMPDHIHLLIGEPQIATPSTVMQVLNVWRHVGTRQPTLGNRRVGHPSA